MVVEGPMQEGTIHGGRRPCIRGEAGIRGHGRQVSNVDVSRQSQWCKAGWLVVGAEWNGVGEGVSGEGRGTGRDNTGGEARLLATMLTIVI